VMSDFEFTDMTPELQTYLDHDDGDREDWKAWRDKRDTLAKLVTGGLISCYYNKAHRAWACRDETISKSKVIKSGSGKYELHLSWHETGKNTWNLSRGKVFRDGELITTVFRNYSSFPHLFVEGHPKGSFLVCGEDYQGQTVIELDTGKRIDLLPKEAEQGHGFCWSSYEYNEANQMLVVNGCIWAAPYEYRFYDFSDPMNGWPELEIEADGEPSYIDSDERDPEIGDDGALKCFQINDDHPDYDWDDDAPAEKQPVASIRTFKREGAKFVQVSEWVSDFEKKCRTDQEEGRRKYEEWENNFKATDPLYLKYIELGKDPKLSPQDYSSRGITHDNWCPDFKVQESRWCRRIVTKKPYSVDFEWAVKTGPIKLVVYKDGDHVEDKFWMDHSVESVEAAFAYTRELVGSP